MKTILRSDDLSCPSCIVKIEKGLSAIEGVEKAKVFFNTGRIEIAHNPETAKSEDFVKKVREIGYESKVSAF